MEYAYKIFTSNQCNPLHKSTQLFLFFNDMSSHKILTTKLQQFQLVWVTSKQHPNVESNIKQISELLRNFTSTGISIPITKTLSQKWVGRERKVDDILD
jgi:hypothetical protein